MGCAGQPKCQVQCITFVVLCCAGSGSGSGLHGSATKQQRANGSWPIWSSGCQPNNNPGCKPQKAEPDESSAANMQQQQPTHNHSGLHLLLWRCQCRLHVNVVCRLPSDNQIQAPKPGKFGCAPIARTPIHDQRLTRHHLHAFQFVFLAELLLLLLLLLLASSSVNRQQVY